ncbi:MAG TPA: ATP-binding protein, partial [Candidatus Deferrimicrobium sp.]|nr:ATP-binding protein [Candidatus Deferrimicrobium sp.]
MARRLSSPVFIGRTDEFLTLLATARAADAGRPSIVLVGGEAGVGKSRLVAEAATTLRDSGWLVLEGGSVALGDDALPFGPIVEVLRALARDVDPETIAAAAGPTLPVLARLVPELSPMPAEADGTAASTSIGFDWLQIRIFEGLLRMLGRLGADRPVLLVIEDLHWADRSTRDLLAFLWRNARDERLCIVGTFRSDELHRRHPLTAWLAEAERQPRVDRLDLHR